MHLQTNFGIHAFKSFACLGMMLAWIPAVTAESSNARMDAVFLAPTHVMQPGQPCFKFTGKRAALIKANVISPGGAAAPKVAVIVTSVGEINTFSLAGPAMLPKALITRCK